MKAPLLVGVGFAILIIAAALAAPLLRTTEERAAQTAREQALLAQRQLARVSLVLPRLNEHVDTKRVMEDAAAVETAASAVGEPLRERSREYDESIRRAKELARRTGLPEAAPAKPAADAGGLRRAYEAFATLSRANEDLLQRALKTSNAAAQVQEAGNPIGVAFAAGLAHYARAATAQLDAQALRTRQAAAQTRLLHLHSHQVRLQSELDHLRALDPAKTSSQLQRDLAEVGGLQGQAAELRADLAARTSERQAQIAELDAELKQVSAALREVEHRSFPAGNDAAYQSYRRQFGELARRAATLEQQLQEQRFGARTGAELPEDDLVAGEISGGEPLLGADELAWRLGLAEERTRRLENAQRDITAFMNALAQRGEQTRGRRGGYQSSLEQLAAAQTTIGQEILALHQAATAEEQEALQAVEAALRAFGSAQRANESWLTATRGKRSQLDPAGRNERLRRVAQDAYLEHAGRVAEAATRLLAGRIHAQQIDALEILLANATHLPDSARDPSFDADQLREQAETARAAGIQTLEKARDLYTTVAEKLSKEPTGWIPRGGLATALYALSRIDPQRAAEHLDAARKTLDDAVEKRERFPYAQSLVQLRAHLASLEGGAAPATPSEPEAAPAAEPPAKGEEEPAEAPPTAEDEEDFFLKD